MFAMTKVCTSCGVEKTFEEFYLRTDGSGLPRGYCKACIIARTRQWQDENRERARSHRKRWRMKAQYGITPEERKKIATKQKHRCKICRRKVALVIDHCHKTGKVRGLLCIKCNSYLGHFKDDPRLFERAISYLRGE